MTPAKSWRDIAAPIIHKVLVATQGLSEEEIRKALFDAYPFNERKYWPYKVWCDEIRRQRKRHRASPVPAGQSTFL